MSRTTKPKKKFNPNKIVEQNQFKQMNRTLVCWAGNLKEEVAFTTEGLYLDLRPRDISNILMLRQFKWSCLCLVICRDHQGRNYFQSLPIHSTQSYKYSTLVDIFNEQHQKLVKEANDLHRITSAWIASPSGMNISDELADKIMSQIGVWEYKSKLESKMKEKINE